MIGRCCQNIGYAMIKLWCKICQWYLCFHQYGNSRYSCRQILDIVVYSPKHHYRNTLFAEYFSKHFPVHHTPPVFGIILIERKQSHRPDIICTILRAELTFLIIYGKHICGCEGIDICRCKGIWLAINLIWHHAILHL